MYGPWSATPAALPVSPSVPVPPFTPFADPPATPLPLKSFSLVIALDRSTVGMVVGMLTAGVEDLEALGRSRRDFLRKLDLYDLGRLRAFGFGVFLRRRRKLLLGRRRRLGLLHFHEPDVLQPSPFRASARRPGPWRKPPERGWQRVQYHAKDGPAC